MTASRPLRILRALCVEALILYLMQLRDAAGPAVEDRQDLVGGRGGELDDAAGDALVAIAAQAVEILGRAACGRAPPTMTGGCGCCTGLGHVIIGGKSTSSP